MYMFSAADCLSVFCEYMEVKCEMLGLSNNTFFKDPCGIDNVSCASDMVRCLIRGYECEGLRSIWNQGRYTVKLRGKEPRDFPLVSTVFEGPDSHLLTDEFEVLGGKTGTLTKYAAFNVSVIAKIPDSDDLMACTIMYADEENEKPRNRFAAARDAMRIAVKKYHDRSYDTSADDVCAKHVMVCVVPPRCEADEYHAKLDVLYAKNSMEQAKPASMTKMLTSVIAFEYLDDPNEVITVTQEMIDSIPTWFYGEDLKAGDEVTVRDLLHALMLPSSNAAAFILGVHIGHKILNDMD